MLLQLSSVWNTSLKSYKNKCASSSAGSKPGHHSAQQHIARDTGSELL